MTEPPDPQPPQPQPSQPQPSQPQPSGARKLTRKQTRNLTAAVLAALVAVTVLVVALVKPWQGDTVDDYIEQSGIADKSILRVGVFADSPLTGIARRANANRLADYEGFDIEIARALGGYLGYVEESIQPVQTEVYRRAIDLSEGKVDIVIANYSMTADREENVDFAGPYMISKLAVLVRAPQRQDRPFTFSQLKTFDAAGKVCTTGGSTSVTALQEEGFGHVHEAEKNSDCAEGVATGKYDAFVLDEVILAGYADGSDGALALVGLVTDRFEKYGIAVSNGDEHLRQVIGNFLLDSYERREDSAWRHAWNRTLGRVLHDKPQPRPENVRRLRDYQDRYPVSAPPFACPDRLLRPRS